MQQLLLGILLGLLIGGGGWFLYQRLTAKPEKASQLDGETSPTTVSLERVVVLQEELREARRRLDVLRRELAQTIQQNEDLYEQVRDLQAEKDTAVIHIAELSASAEALEVQVFESQKQYNTLALQIQDADDLIDQLETLSTENNQLRTQLDEASATTNLPHRLAEVITNLTETKSVLESAMQEFGGLHGPETNLRQLLHNTDTTYLNGTAEQDTYIDPQTYAELQHEYQQLQAKFVRISRVVSDVWHKYRTTIGRLHEIADLEEQNHKLDLQLRVSNIKLEILRERLTVVARRPDDLAMIRGITPEYKQILRQVGIDTFADLAALTPAHIQRIIKNGYIEPDQWIREAKRLAGRAMHLQSWLAQTNPRARRNGSHGRGQMRNELDQKLTNALANQ